MNLTTGQYIACQHHLCDYPDNYTFKQILEGIEDDDENIMIWEQVIEWNRDELIHHLSGLAKSIDDAINNCNKQTKIEV